eukprot:Opistho-2@74197
MDAPPSKTRRVLTFPGVTFSHASSPATSRAVGHTSGTNANGAVQSHATPSSRDAKDSTAAPSASTATLVPVQAARLPPRVAVDNADSRVDKALRVRLYLLRLPGPNSFIVCSDATESTHTVHLGPQTCTCGRDYCVHLLFVLLRVLMVPRNSPVLWSKPLKDYETEALMTAYYGRRTAIIYGKRHASRNMLLDHAGGNNHQHASRVTEGVASASASGTDVDAEWEFAPKSEEDVPCPICLLDLLEGETITWCRKGCGNRYHSYCMSIWADERTKQAKKVYCPLCRADWKQHNTHTHAHAHAQYAGPASGALKHHDSTAVVLSSSAASAFTPTTSSSTCLSSSTSQASGSVLSDARVTAERVASLMTLTIAGTDGPDSGYTSLVSSPSIVSPSPHTSGNADSNANGGATILITTTPLSAMAGDDPNGPEGVTTRTETNLGQTVGTVTSAAGASVSVSLSMSVSVSVAPGPATVPLSVALGAPLVAQLGSRNWITRETALKSLTVVVTTAISACDASVVQRSLDGATAETLPSHAILEAVCECVATAIADPVARVHQSAVAAVSNILAAEDMPFGVQPSNAKRALASLLDAVTTRVSDANKRIGASSLSLACRLALDPRWGPSTVVPLVLSLSNTVASNDKQRPWRWWHGRLLLSLNILEQSPSALIDSRRGDPVIKHVIPFALAALSIRHARVNRRAVDLIVECCAIAEQVPALLPTAKAAVAQLQPAMSRSVAFRLAHRRKRRTSIKSKPSSPRKTPNPSGSHDAPSSSTFASNLKDGYFEAVSPAEDEGNRYGNGDDAENKNYGVTCAEKMRAEEEELDMERSRGLEDEHASGQLLEGLDAAIAKIHLEKDVISDVYPCVPAALFPEGTFYTVKQRLGRGGNASVHLALDASGRKFALKRIDGACATALERDSALRSATREAAILRTLRHPGIVGCLGGVYEASGDGDSERVSLCSRVHAYKVDIFLELMAGGTLSNLLSRAGSLPLGRVRDYTRQILAATAHMHARGIIHRDLKCANILLSADLAVAKITDFGSSSRMSGCMTMTGEFTAGHFGTVAFMAPEVIRGESHGRACDVWSLGCTVLHMVSGRIPWSDADENANNNNNNNRRIDNDKDDGNAPRQQNNFTLMYRIASGNNLPAFPEICHPSAVDFMSRCIVRDPRQREHAQALLFHPFLEEDSDEGIRGKDVARAVAAANGVINDVDLDAATAANEVDVDAATAADDVDVDATTTANDVDVNAMDDVDIVLSYDDAAADDAIVAGCNHVAVADDPAEYDSDVGSELSDDSTNDNNDC